MTAKNTINRWAVCKAMAAMTGVPSQTFFQHFAYVDENIANAALTQPSGPDIMQDQVPVDALREHIRILSSVENMIQNLPPAAVEHQPADAPAPDAISDHGVADYVQRLRLTLWFITQCGGVSQAKFILDQAAKSFPEDTQPAFSTKRK